MTRFAIAAIITITLVSLYAVNPLVAMSIITVGATVLFAVIALSMRSAEQDDIARTMAIVDCYSAADARDTLFGELAA